MIIKKKLGATRIISFTLTLTLLLSCISISGCGRKNPEPIERAEVQYVEPEKETDGADGEVAQNNIIQFPGTTAATADDENKRTTLSREGYTLEQAVVLSRHYIRAPLSGSGSALDTITPHTWFNWSAEASQLSVRGGTLETEMGSTSENGLNQQVCLLPIISLQMVQCVYMPIPSKEL